MVAIAERQQVDKAQQLRMLAAVLPDDAKVRQMLHWWEEFDQRYWQGKLRPCWLQAAIVAYGHAVGLHNPGCRTITVVPQMWSVGEDAARAVLLHEMAHQAAHELYADLNGATGPRGKWFDTSHRCPAWSRAVEDWIQREGLDVFCPVWHRSSGNKWHPWVPADDDWETWRKVSPDDSYQGRRLLSFEDAKFGPVAARVESIADACGWDVTTIDA